MMTLMMAKDGGLEFEALVPFPLILSAVLCSANMLFVAENTVAVSMIP